MIRFVTAYGQRDSHAVTLANGDPNRSPRAGTPYNTVTWAEIVAMAATPKGTTKDRAQFFIPTDYHACDARKHEVQRDNGRFWAIALDVDKGAPSFEELDAALVAVLGDVERLIYSSSGALADKPKWRALIPLASCVPGKDYLDTQLAFFAALAEQGIIADPALRLPGQPVFLPNVPPDKRGEDGTPLFYRATHIERPRLRIEDGSPLVQRREAMRAAEAEEERQAQIKSEEYQAKRLEYIKATGDDFEPIEHFNQSHSVAEMLGRYGFQKHARTNDYTSPLSESGSYSTKDFGDHWVTVSAWAANHGVGRPSRKSGNYFGDAFDLYTYFEHGGDKSAAVRAYAQEVRPDPPTPPAGGGQRAPDGRFTGSGLQRFSGEVKPTGKPLPLNDARMKTADDIDTALAECLAWDGEGLAPVFVIKSDPGLGKSRLTREKIASSDFLSQSTGDVHFYSPTLALSDEAANHAEGLSLTHAVTRGRLAKSPATGTPMCDRPAEVERVGKLGQPIKPTMCIAQDETGATRACPFFDGCAHRAQFLSLPDQNAVRFEALNYLTLKDGAEGREVGIRIIDETFWKAMGREATITIDALSAGRSVGRVDDGPKKDERTAVIADLLECVSTLTTALRQGKNVMDAVAGYTAEDLRQFAKAEKWSEHRLPFFPDADANTMEEALKAGEAHNAQAGAKAQFWSNIADAIEAGVSDLQNVVFIAGHKPTKTSDPRDVVRVYWHTTPPRDVPVIILDADADSTLIDPFYPDHTLERTQVLPNADVIYITDKTFSKTALMKKSARDEWRGVIAVERMQDQGGGVLVVASKQVVKAFYADAGYDLSEMDDAEANAFMIDTPLHGVQWAWFGPMTLGSNRWKDCTTCIVMGREEWPVYALENEARKIWGHGLQMIEADETGQINMPEIEVPFPMADGTTYSVTARVHPDPRVRAIQMQARECTTRQSAERLRLASATTRKRLIIGSKIPIPGLPATQALTWADYLPKREVAALAEAGGALRLSPKGMAEDAPASFSTPNAAKFYGVRVDIEESLFGYHASNDNIISRVIPKSAVLVAFRIKGVRGSKKTRAILQCTAAEAEAAAHEKWGELTGFEVLRETIPAPPLSAEAQEAAEAREERIAIIQEGSGLGFIEATRVADRAASDICPWPRPRLVIATHPPAPPKIAVGTGP